jgi:hypothetical protein
MTTPFYTVGSRNNVHSVFAATILLLLVPFISGFVNVPAMRKPAFIQSTFTSVTDDQAHVVLTDSFQRDPFAQDGQGEDVDDRDVTATTVDWLQQQDIPAQTHGFWLSQMAESVVGQLPPASSRLVIQAELTRQKLKKKLRVQLHNFLRDSGLLRGIMDFAVTIGTPALALERPEIFPQFLQLTQNAIHFPYGTHQRQVIEMHLPEAAEEPKGLVFFVVRTAFGTVVCTMLYHYLTGLYVLFLSSAWRGLGKWATMAV